MKEYLYIIHLREFIKSSEDTYKVGKTIQKNCKRTGSYPKGSVVHYVESVSDCDLLEKLVINKFTSEFKRRLDYGYEYFEGDLTEMKSLMFSIIRSFEKMSDYEKEKIRKIYKNKEMSIFTQDYTNSFKTMNNKVASYSRYYCELCDYKTDDSGNFCRHRQSKKHKKSLCVYDKVKAAHDSYNHKKFTCHNCGEDFARKYNLQRHINRKTCKG